jgi:AraC family transcriptional regulator
MSERCVPVTMGSPKFTSREVGGLRVTEAHFPPGLVLPMHIHERATVAVMLEGSFDCVFPGRTLPCNAGALHSEPAEERHGNRIGRLGAHVVVIQPDQREVVSMGAHARVLEQVNYVRQSVAAGLAWRLAREVHLADSAAPLAIEGLVLEILAEAVRWSDDNGARSSTPPWLSRAQEYIHGNFSRPFRIADVAHEVSVNPVRLARSFRRRFGMSLGAYCRKLRLEWAGIALASTDEPLSVIAARAGFADQSHLTRAFRAHTGMTPLRFRVASRR